MIFSSGAAQQALYDRWDPFDVDYVWIAWDEILRGATISDSEWIAPAVWTIAAEHVSASVTDEDGNTYDAVNGALLSTTATAGRHKISNRVSLSDGRQYERTVIIVVQEL